MAKNKINLQNVKGMKDILPKEDCWWSFVRKVSEKVSRRHDFHFIETPILELAKLFELGVGANTDIVEKEMYTFKTKGGELVALRPENTAPIMRSYLQNQLGYFASPLKVFYFGPFFRYEKPQAGRERQFHQWGFEIIGDSDPVYDIEVILVCLDVFENLKIKEVKLKLNTIGCRACRSVYRQKLKSYYRSKKSKLCKDCQRRYERNIFRLLDCKEKICQEIKKEAPIIFDYLCAGCKNHFQNVLEILEDNKIDYEPDPYLVRGLDYYNRTVFEFTHPSVNFELGGGGRYDYLSELIGGRAIPGVGAAYGVERIIELMKIQKINPLEESPEKIFFIAIGEQAKKSALKLINQLRQAGFFVSEALGKKSLRAQLKSADKNKAKIALIYGQKEFFEESIILRELDSGLQEEILLKDLIEEVSKRVNQNRSQN